MMILKNQTPDVAINTFHTHMQRDFPQSEIKPWEIAMDLYRRGIYEMLEAWEDGKMVGYVWTVCPAGDAVLIDYLAVLPEFRGSGVGSRMLNALRRRYQNGGKILLLESEYPQEAPDLEIARRRLGFYARAGFADTGVQVRLFGVRFCILSPVGEGAKWRMTEIYRAMFPEELYHQAVEFLE